MEDFEPNEHYGKLTHQQQRFCDLYLTHFNAFKAAVESGYSENTSRKGALLHVPKIQRYLKERMAARSQRLEITHDMILRELSKIAFSNMGNYYDEYACLKRMNELTVDEKAAIAYYDIVEIQDAEGYRVGTQSRIKLHNKMSALDKIARHLNFYGVLEPKAESEKPKAEQDCVVVDRSEANLPMDYPNEDFELEGIELKTLVALEDVNVSPGRAWDSLEPEAGSFELSSIDTGSSSYENQTVVVGKMEKFLTISPLVGRGSESGVEGREPVIGDLGLKAPNPGLKNAFGSR